MITGDVGGRIRHHPAHVHRIGRGVVAVEGKVRRSPLPGERILEPMTRRIPAKRRHLASSPFRSQSEPVIEQFALGDRVSHDTYGVGRVMGWETDAVTVDFGTHTVRVASPFRKMEKL